MIYLDTENNFRPERIEQVVKAGLDTEQTLENIVVGTANTTDEQMGMMSHICALLADADQGPFRVLVVDSIISLFRVDFSGRGELSERQQKLNQHMKQSNVAQSSTSWCSSSTSARPTQVPSPCSVPWSSESAAT